MVPMDPQAVLEGRVPGRPTAGLIIALTVSTLCALGVLGLYGWFGGGMGFVAALLLAILPIPLLISLVLTLDRVEPEPPRTLALAFMWGAGVAVLGALVLNTAGLIYVTVPVFGEAEGHFVSATVGAPLIEETLKGAVLFLLLWLRRTEIDGFADGIIYAAMVGLGFAMMENVTYYMRAFDEGGADQLTAVFVLRGVIAPFSHPLFTSMLGLGVAWAATHRNGRVAAPLVGLIAAMALHALWNGATTFGLGGLAVVYAVDFVLVLVLIAIVFVERRGTLQRIGRYLPMYEPTGLVTPQDVRMLVRMSSRRAARRWAREVGGQGAARAMDDYQLAATELALVHKRAERGTADPVWLAERRDALLSLMAVARQAFLRAPKPLPEGPPWAPGGGPSGFRRSEEAPGDVPDVPGP
ncbi:PrsW family intramembrane metalloprotease [Thermomonospora umbrina]|uniref:RsiW-degrading membrane proteinase PrsW (M82 family) n=1 Tax=Thermomonospora umbrina TaxID=111806 RepID=A0A3D9SZ59_9ACTN|nr:PrsW family intramembrane metalloprotease [Thermomonospora umbrina]REF01129.1 RsiW-degrading membrane proteinase PrsW (M82 family) [Thermomonospora umbrina]